MLLGESFEWETDIKHCKDQKVVGMDCFYEPWSSCSLQDTFRDKIINLKSLKAYYPGQLYPVFIDDFGKKEILELLQDQVAIVLLFRRGLNAYRNHNYRSKRKANYNFDKIKKIIPSNVLKIIECSPMKADIYHYYWRAVSVTFFIRPNQPTLELMMKYSNNLIEDGDKNLINLFVRHGDKGIEMQLIPFKDYAITAQLLVNNGYLYKYPNSDFVGTIVLSTDDEEVIREALLWGRENNWKIIYPNIYDRSNTTDHLDFETQQQLIRMGKAKHHELTYFSMLINLELSLKCDAWVCTLASNTCRIIDELRSTIGCKANGHFADLSKETCLSPPCIGSGIYNFGD